VQAGPFATPSRFDGEAAAWLFMRELESTGAEAKIASLLGHAVARWDVARVGETAEHLGDARRAVERWMRRVRPL
jgi:hypothetical protein